MTLVRGRSAYLGKVELAACFNECLLVLRILGKIANSANSCNLHLRDPRIAQIEQQMYRVQVAQHCLYLTVVGSDIGKSAHGLHKCQIQASPDQKTELEQNMWYN